MTRRSAAGAMACEAHRRSRALSRRAAAARSIVGGWVRDRLLGRPSKDVDLEVFGIPAGRAATLCSRASAPVNTVGESFTVYKVGGHRRLAAAPRIEDRPRPSRLRGRRAIPHVVEDAARRRDFTVNAIVVGSADRRVPRSVRRPRAICERGVLRAVDPQRSATTACACCAACSSPRDSSSTLDAGDARLCRAIPLDDLPAERDLGRNREAAAAGRSARRSVSRSRWSSASSTGCSRSCRRSSAARRSPSGIPKATSGCTR